MSIYENVEVLPYRKVKSYKFDVTTYDSCDHAVIKH